MIRIGDKKCDVYFGSSKMNISTIGDHIILSGETPTPPVTELKVYSGFIRSGTTVTFNTIKGLNSYSTDENNIVLGTTNPLKLDEVYWLPSRVQKSDFESEELFYDWCNGSPIEKGGTIIDGMTDEEWEEFVIYNNNILYLVYPASINKEFFMYQASVPTEIKYEHTSTDTITDGNDNVFNIKKYVKNDNEFLSDKLFSKKQVTWLSSIKTS